MQNQEVPWPGNKGVDIRDIAELDCSDMRGAIKIGSVTGSEDGSKFACVGSCGHLHVQPAVSVVVGQTVVAVNPTAVVTSEGVDSVHSAALYESPIA